MPGDLSVQIDLTLWLHSESVTAMHVLQSVEGTCMAVADALCSLQRVAVIWVGCGNQIVQIGCSGNRRWCSLLFAVPVQE